MYILRSVSLTSRPTWSPGETCKDASSPLHVLLLDSWKPRSPPSPAVLVALSGGASPGMSSGGFRHCFVVYIPFLAGYCSQVSGDMLLSQYTLIFRRIWLSSLIPRFWQLLWYLFSLTPPGTAVALTRFLIYNNLCPRRELSNVWSVASSITSEARPRYSHAPQRLTVAKINECNSALSY